MTDAIAREAAEAIAVAVDGLATEIARRVVLERRHSGRIDLRRSVHRNATAVLIDYLTAKFNPMPEFREVDDGRDA